jgi:hypothetical protein
MQAPSTPNLIESFWLFIGSNQVAVIVTVIGILVTIWGIWITLRKPKKHSPKSSKNTSLFITGEAVTPPNFIGRTSELKQLHACLQTRESTSLLGDARIGKSSLLLTWQQQIREQQSNYPILYVNGQNQEGENLQAFLQAITKEAICDNPSPDQAANLLVKWAEKQKLKYGRTPIILVDECERIIKQCPHRFWERVRGALGKIIWVFTSRKPLNELYRSEHNEGSPFENQLKTIWLSLLDKAAAEKLIQRGKFPKQQQTLLEQWAGQHPFYLQCFARQLDLHKQDTQKALDHFKMEAVRHLQDWWKNIPAKEQQQLMTAIEQEQAIDSTVLRSRGLVTRDGHPFANILVYYLKQQS